MQHFADSTVVVYIFLFNFLLLDQPFHPRIMQRHFICQIFSLGKNCRENFFRLHIASIDVAALCAVANCDRLIFLEAFFRIGQQTQIKTNAPRLSLDEMRSGMQKLYLSFNFLARGTRKFYISHKTIKTNFHSGKLYLWHEGDRPNHIYPGCASFCGLPQHRFWTV